jgi:hypothetical protein
VLRRNPTRVIASGGGGLGQGVGGGNERARAGWAGFGGGAALRLLREQSLDPSGVDEVAGAGEAGEEEDVQEETGMGVSGENLLKRKRGGGRASLHLGIEDGNG